MSTRSPIRGRALRKSMPGTELCISNLFKLVDSCNQCSFTLRVAAEHIPNDAFRRFSDEFRRTLDRFGFELQTEIRRIDETDLDIPRTYVENSSDAVSLRQRCELTFRTMVSEYETIQASGIPPHARAMVQRQSRALEELWRQFEDVSMRATA